MTTNHEYHPDGAGRQRFDAEDYLSPPQDEIPQNAQFGLWDFDTKTWLYKWYFNANDAQFAADEIARSSGLNIGIISIDGWEYFNPSGFE